MLLVFLSSRTSSIDSSNDDGWINHWVRSAAADAAVRSEGFEGRYESEQIEVHAHGMRGIFRGPAAGPFGGWSRSSKLVS